VQPSRALRLAGIGLLVVAQQLVVAAPVSADAPCINGLPIDHTYGNAHWHTGGLQNHGTPIRGVRANIRTYNPFAADTPSPYTGGVSAWVMLENGTAWAQAGWLKAPFTSDKFNPLWFWQYTDSSGFPLETNWQAGAKFPPTVYTYQVFYIPNGSGGGNFQFLAGDTQLTTSTILFWTPLTHDASTEVFNFTGDQSPGDNTAHTTFRSVGWWDGTTWFGSTFGTPADTYFVGHSPEGNPSRTWDSLTFTDGSNFDTWDSRCP
jgi:hypothetical protein